MFEEIFLRKRLNEARLEPFGFVYREGLYHYTKKIMENDFLLSVTIGKKQAPDVRVIEAETGEEYILYKTNAQGSFVGAVREAIRKVLTEIAEACYETEIFHTSQAKMLIGFALDTYGDEPEFLWKKLPDYAVLRRRDSRKWYCLIGKVSKRKLGLESDENAEIINLHLPAEHMAELLKQKGYYPGYHMNKKSWYSVILDGSVPDKELQLRLGESYALAKK